MRKRWMAGTVVGLALIAAAIAGSASASTTTTVVVTPADLTTAAPTATGQFVVIDQKSGGGSGGGAQIVSGPGAPPLGASSLQLSVTGSSDHWSVYNYDHIGTKLSDITALSYATYTDNTTTAPALQMEINPEPGGSVQYATLNFEPYMNPAEQTLAANTWQTWNALAGKVWLTYVDPSVNGGEGSQSSPVTWAQLLSDYPNAEIKYGFGVNVGSDWSAMTGASDALTIGTADGTTVYNFEQLPTTKEACKKGGWQAFGAFKNQGDCVSYVATGGKNSAAG